MLYEEITYKIRRVLLSVHQDYGPGLFESVYQQVLFARLSEAGLRVRREVPIHLDEYGLCEKVAFRIDLVVEGCILLELKAVEALHPIHFRQVTTYLRLSGIRVGLLINFNALKILTKPGFNRIMLD